MRIQRVLGAALLLGLLVIEAVGHPAQASAAESCFRETGFCIQGRFLEYWNANGGLARNGFPLGPERREVLEDNKEYTVQYFERVRLEAHPENPAPYDVLLGQFGRRILAEAYVVRRSAYASSVAPAEPIAGQVYFAQTGHNLGGRFLDYWTANGGLAQFGFPITEERFDTLEDRLVYRTQYFERARFEYHPEYEDTPYAVLLGQFGRRIQTENEQLGARFGRLYLSDTTLQVRLGAPVRGESPTAGATLAFEHGRMFYAAQAPPQQLLQGGFLDPAEHPTNPALVATATGPMEETQPTIYVLCGDPQRGEVRASTYDFSYFWRDTWDESQPPGGGPGPQPGLYEPKRGFGKVWRDRQRADGLIATGARACLGYATSADEVAFTITVQYFQGGALLYSDTPDGRYIYVLTVGRYTNSGPPTGTYEQYPAP